MTKFTEILPEAIELNSVSVVESFLNSFDTVLTDCDGVLWNESEPIQGSPEAINLLRRLGKKVVYVTNNSGHTRVGYVQISKTLALMPTSKLKISSHQPLFVPNISRGFSSRRRFVSLVPFGRKNPQWKSFNKPELPVLGGNRLRA